MFDFKVSEEIVFGVTITMAYLQSDDVKYHINFYPSFIIVMYNDIWSTTSWRDYE